jgi:L-lactate utilization protein LutB
MRPRLPDDALCRRRRCRGARRGGGRHGGSAPGTPEALAWIAACTRSGVCTPACPERIDAAFMLRLATWRAKGALGEPPRIPVKEDTQYSPKVKAFARLTLTEEEQREWL